MPMEERGERSRDVRDKRDLVLPPGSYAYMQDTTKGTLKTYVGPTVINPTAQEIPIKYDAKRGTFTPCALEEAMCRCPVAVEGYYVMLLNPAKANKHPEDGTAQPSADLEVGRKIIIPGPANFALWPGQTAEIVRGHHLHSNQYLLVRVYNEDEAKANWGKAVVKLAGETGRVVTEKDTAKAIPMPADLSVGRLIIIRGTEVSFYVPPTGITVVAETGDAAGKHTYVRDALTLERLEYAILIDEGGRKRFERGPQVVFPTPTEEFVESKSDKGELTKKFRAIELNEIQGLHIKVIADYTDESGAHKAGDELFITGKETAIYFPREEHSAIKYDGRAKHFATAVPSGEGRYVMDRMNGQIQTARGPAMLLPDPRHQVVVRRMLSEKQAMLWYPGNADALAYNQGLKAMLSNVPTTRAGAISEGDYSRSVGGGQRRTGGGPTKSAVMSYAASNSAALMESLMESSMVSSDQSLVAEEFSRASTYTQPRSITLDTKFQGVPSVDVWVGYAVMVTSKSGKRRVEQGPTTILLDYDETLETLELSTGKPKTTDNLLSTVYLRVANNKVTDVVEVETSDHVRVGLKVSYLVNFEGDANKWFNVENYVKFLTDHCRSVLKGAMKKVKIEELYANHADLIRDCVLGKAADGKRTGMLFVENGMHVMDVDILTIGIGDEKIRVLLDSAQMDVVKSNIDLSNANRQLEVFKQKQGIEQELQKTAHETQTKVIDLQEKLALKQLELVLIQVGNKIQELEEEKKKSVEMQAVKDIEHDADMARTKRREEQKLQLMGSTLALKMDEIKSETEATVARFNAAVPGFSAALTELGNKDMLSRVAESWSIQRVIGGDSVSDALRHVFAGTPMEKLAEKLLATGVDNGGGNGKLGEKRQ